MHDYYLRTVIDADIESIFALRGKNRFSLLKNLDFLLNDSVRIEDKIQLVFFIEITRIFFLM